ncbi:MAG: hypothetical protein OEZ40_08045 [Candidatus Bathyarchaeota archaeon]|nr:hypothetical protein [Candidatus Bathyarchaeota archaeon]
MIILILCSIVFGALISYLWVMANYYNMPEGTTLLVVKDAVFPAHNATYFNVTILNPSNSVSDANISAIRLSVDEKTDVYNITTADPTIPFVVKRGTEQAFKCEQNWGNLAGETVIVEPIPVDAATKNYSYTTPKVTLPKVEMKLTPDFDISTTIEYFNLTIENSGESVINLTLLEVSIFGFAMNTTPAFPYVLPPGQHRNFRCERDWQNLMGGDVTINVRTEEGYEASYTTDVLPGVFLYIGNIRFDYTETSYFNLTVISTEESTSDATLNKINLTLRDDLPITLSTVYPSNISAVPITLLRNQSVVIKCLWDWSIYRGEIITVEIYTLQGIISPAYTAVTPPSIVWNITDVKFDLDYTEYFLVNVTNMPCSLNEINITMILLENNVTSMDPPSATLTNGMQAMFNCTFDWKALRGQNIIVKVQTQDGVNVSRAVTLPSVQLKLLDDNFVFGDLHNVETNVTIPYVNVTVSNSVNSVQNLTITKIIIETYNETYLIDNTLTYPKLAPSGYTITVGENTTILCISDYERYLASNEIKVTVYTSEGIQTSRTYVLPP